MSNPAGSAPWAKPEIKISRIVLKDLYASLKECSDDLEYEIAARFIGQENYPSMMHRKARDMQPVEDARLLLKTLHKEM